MAVAEFNLEKTLRKTLTLSEHAQIKIALNTSRNHKSISVIDVTYGDERKEYVAVQVDDIKVLNQTVNSSVRSPLFSFRDTNEKNYLVYENFSVESCDVSPNRKQLGVILTKLATHQAQQLAGHKDTDIIIDNVRQLYELVISQDYFKNIDLTDAEREVSRLDKELKKICESNLLVKSVCNISQRNVFFDDQKQCIILDVGMEKLVPPVYDALFLIFTLTDEQFRQRHFVTLISNYFDTLQSSLQKINTTLADKITQEYKEATVRFLATIIKFELVAGLKAPEDIKLNTLRFLKYPLVNQEDVYEIIYNKLNTVDVILLDYNMKCLDERNGHLGQYFHLTVVVNDGENKTLDLFVKMLITENEALQEVVRNGPAEKEDFFYNTLLPLFEQNGLHDLLDFAPACFLSRHNWMLVLNDLMKEGYTTAKMNLPLNLDGLTAIVTTMAKLTAASLITEEKESEKKNERVSIYDMFPEKFKETVIVYEEDSAFASATDCCKEGIYYFLELCPDITEKSGLPFDEVIKRTDEMYMSLFDHVSKSETYVNSVTHGDMHVGNMLFLRGENDKIIKANLVDFQIIRYMPPVFDLVFFLYLNASRDDRLKYMTSLINSFYQDVSKYLQRFGYDPNQVFPRDSFNESLKSVRSAVLSLTLMYGHMMKTEPKLREKLFHENYELYMIKNKRAFIDINWSDAYYKKTMRDYMQDVIEYITDDNQ